MLYFCGNNGLQVPQRPYTHHLRTAMLYTGIAIISMISLSGCNKDDNSVSDIKQYFKDPSGEPMKAVVRTTLPLAYAASVAMASVSGTPPHNASASNTCSSYPCTALVTITVDNSTLPLQFVSYGTIAVAGLWDSANTAILTVSFTNMFAGSSLYPVHYVATFPVARTSTGLLEIVYPNVDIDISTGATDPANLTPQQKQTQLALLSTTTASTDPSVNVKMDAWIVSVDNAGTTYRISGGGQYVDVSSGAVSILQLGMADVVMGPGCALNPTSGLALQNEVATSSATTSSQVVIATAAFSFGSACTGNAKILGATGNYLLSNGKSIPLNLINP
jgi:hypothetical protein